MRIAILSDFHLGYERFREDAFVQAEEALNKAAELADAIIIPGDIFDMRVPKPDVIAEAINLFRNLSKKKWDAQVTELIGEGTSYTKLPIIAIPGTHERRAQDAADPVDILGLAGLLIDVSNATAVVEQNGEKVAIRGIGGIADERFREVIQEFRPQPIEGAFNIFMFHESLYELLPFSEEFLRYNELPEGFDLYVCGHIHSRVEADVRGKKLLIPGSTVLTQLRDGEQDRKGLYIYDTKTMTHEYVHINSRKFVMKKISVSGKNEGAIVSEAESIINAAVESSKERPVVRIVIDGKLPKGSSIEIDINDLSRKYREKAIVEISKAGITADSVKEVSGTGMVFDKMSVKDYGIGVFVEKLKQQGVTTGPISPVELLDILSSDDPKEKTVKRALEELLKQS